MSNNLLRLDELIEKIALSRSSILNLYNPESTQYDPTFPKPAKISQRVNAWRESEVNEWIDSKFQQSSKGVLDA